MPAGGLTAPAHSRGGRHTGPSPTSGRMPPWLPSLTPTRPSRSARSTAATAAGRAARRPPLEAALNRRAGARRGRVADPPDAPTASCPGVRTLTDDEIAALRGVVDDFGPDEVAELGRDRAGHGARRQGGRVLPQGAARGIAPAEEDGGARPSSCTSRARARTSTTSPTPSWSGAPSSRCGCPRPRRSSTRSPTIARELKDVPLLAHTHGQPATPTTLGKELAVLAHRLGRQLRRIERPEFLGKLNGATGTFGAHAARAARRRLAGGVARRSSRASA